MKQCATCRNTASATSDYCGSCEQKIERNQRIEELQKRIQAVDTLDPIGHLLLEVADLLLEEAKVLM
jgi:predicted ATP-binding protein involved in virulence